MKVGDEVICIENVKWEIGCGPRKDDILVIRGFKKAYGCTYLHFFEYLGDYFIDKHFAPIISTKDLYKELETIKQPELV